MRKIREVLRLKHEARLSDRDVARAVGAARSTVQECLARARAAGLSWPLPADLDEATLTARLYPARVTAPVVPEPDFEALRAQLSLKGMTRLLLWREYKQAHPEGWEYTAFCLHYRAWLTTQDPVLRQAHAPGDKMFVDYAGLTVDVVDPRTGEARAAQVFVAVLGHSSYTYAEATWTQTVADWLASHVRALEFFGGVPAAAVPDNLKAGVTKAHRYDPDLNPSYQDLAEHYGLTVLPARVRKPRDKAPVETAVQVVERQVLAPLRHQTFFSLAELNEALRAKVVELNQRPFQKREGSRQSVFETVERPALRPLPACRYEYALWKKAKVHLDYHVEVERHYYSVPYTLIGKTVDVRRTAATLEIYLRHQRVAAHARSEIKGGFTTCPAHRPERHRAIVELSHERLVRQAEAIGPSTVAVLQAQFHARKHPEYTLRSCLGILRLARDFNAPQLEAACARALTLKSVSYRAIRSLLRTPGKQTEIPLSLPAHGNVRGPSYYS